VPLGLLLELPSAPLLVDLVDVDCHLLLEDQVADPPVLLLAARTGHCLDVGLYLLPEQLAELNDHSLRSIRVVEGHQSEPALARPHHPVYIVDFSADVVVLDALAQPDALPALLPPALYVPDEVLGVDVSAEGAHGQDGVDARSSLPHQVEVHLQGL
jgi:hypothetical protein